MRNERYYYSVMSPEEKQAYRMIFDGLKARSYHVGVTVDLARNQVQEIYLRVLYDNPLFFYVNQRVIRMTGEPGAYDLLPEYLYSQREILQLTREVRNVVDKVAVKARQMPNEFRLEKYLHDSVVKSVAYDYDSLSKSDCFNAHSIIGCFLDRKAVCEGIAKAFKLLCNEFSMKCIVVLGKASPDGDLSGDCYHAWNLVKVNGNYYYVDTTWGDVSYQMDDTPSGEEAGDGSGRIAMPEINYDYLNVTTAELLRTHSIGGQVPMPLCVATEANYYVREGAYFTSYDREQMEALFRKTLEEGRADVTIKCADEPCYREVVEGLIDGQEIFRYLSDEEGRVAYAQNEKQLSLTFWVTNE